jgi:hypothetical protein
VQSYPSAADVVAGGSASYVVWAWSTSAGASNVTIAGSVTAASYLGSPSFTICPSPSGTTCKITSLPVGQAYELLASVPVDASAALATEIKLTVSATAAGALSDSANATDVVVAPTTAAANNSNSSLDAVPPLQSLPPLAGTGVTATNPSDLFPTLSPSPNSTSLGLPPAKSRPTVRAALTTSAVPIDARLLGAQIVGLAVLLGAVTIAILRLSLRKAQPATSKPADPVDPTAPTPTA